MMYCPWCLYPNLPKNKIHDLCWLFIWAACKTWCDLGYSYRLGNPISEDSITDTLLLEMDRRTNRLVYKRYSRSEEGESGADWLWWFVSGNRGFPVLMQAKRLYPNGKYDALKRKGADQTDQTDRLLNYACKNGWLPLFCFYNSCHPKLDSPLWGCAIASAHSVSKLLSSGVSKANYIDNIKPKSVPWMCLVCPELPIPQKNFPEAVRSRAMDNIPEIGTVPEVVHDLPEYVRQLLNMASNEDSLELPHEESLLMGIVVVSDQPIERQD